MNLSKKRELVDSMLIDLKAAERRCTESRSKLIALEDELFHIEEAQQVVQYIAEHIQQRVHSQIAGVVSKCLESVFTDGGYGFKIRFDKKRGKTEAALMLVKAGTEIEDPLDGDSGAVCQMSGFALRSSCLVLSKPKLRKVLVLDEPFKDISKEYWENTRLLLDSMSKDFGIQIVMVTHNPELYVGKVIEL